MQARGTWLLSFSDTAARTTVKSTQGNDWHDSHGRGAIDDWVLVLTDNQGIARTYHMDISAVVKTLPIYGKLYIYDTKYEARGRPIEFVKGTDQNNEISGSIASWNIVVKNRQVVYSPRRDYLGEDVFSYTTFFGVTESTNTGVVTLETRECRQADCLNDVSSSATANLHELWYRDEGEPLNAYIPRTEDLLDLTNQINDPWLTQPSAGIQGGSCGDAEWYAREMYLQQRLPFHKTKFERAVVVQVSVCTTQVLWYFLFVLSPCFTISKREMLVPRESSGCG